MTVYNKQLKRVIKMEKIKNMLTFLIIVLSLISYSTSLNCDQNNPDIECVLFKQYPIMNDELACQLCAVALQSGKYQQKINQFCLQDQQQTILRECDAMTQFAFLLQTTNIIDSFQKQYQAFYQDSFQHDLRVSSILKKQVIRQALINWLQSNIQDQTQNGTLAKAIANMYLQDLDQSTVQLNLYLQVRKNKHSDISIKLQSRIFEKQGQFNDALNLINQYLVEIQKQTKQTKIAFNIDPYIFHLKGNFLMHHLKFDSAIKQFEKANLLFKHKFTSQHFSHGFVFSNYNIGLCYQKLSKFQEAIKKYSELIAMSQVNPHILNALGNSYVQWAQRTQTLDNQKLKKGIFYLNQAVQADKSYYLAYYNLGYAYLKLNQMQKALQKFKESLTIKQSSQAQYGILTGYLILGRYDQAQQFIKNNLKINQQTIDDFLSILYQSWNIKQNPKFYSKVVVSYEDKIKSANSHYWKGMIEFELQKYGLAIDHFLKAYDQGYKQAHLLFNLAYAYQLIDNKQQALSYYEKSFNKDPRNPTKEKIKQLKKLINQTIKVQKQL